MSATIDLFGPSTNPGAPQITPQDIDNQVNAALLANYNATGGGGPFLTLTGGTLTGNLTISYPTAYSGGRVDFKNTALNIAQTASGATSGQDWIGLNNIFINNDTLDVNAPANVVCSFQGSINDNILTVVQPITGPPSTTLVGSISGSVLTVTSQSGKGIQAGLTLSWTSPTPGTATVISGVGMPSTNLDADYGSIPSQTMTMVGPRPTDVVAWGPNNDPDNPTTATISTFSGTPNQWLLVVPEGSVSLQPMQILKNGAIQQAIGIQFFHFFGGGGASGGRTGLRAHLIQKGPMAATGGNFYQNLIAVGLGYNVGGADVWSGAVGSTVGLNPVLTMSQRGGPGTVGPTNFRGAATMEVDFQCASGSPDNPDYPLASTASVGAVTLVRGPPHQWQPPIWENDFVLGFGQTDTNVRDASGNLLSAKQARFAMRFGGFGSINPIDATTGRAIGVVTSSQAYNLDGTDGKYPMRGRHAIDWYNFDWTGTLYRGRGISLTGSGSALPYAVQVGGGYLSATSSTVSLDAAGSVCTGAAVASGGLQMRAGLACIDDDTGTVVIVTAATNGVATAVSLIPNTGRAINGHLPTNPVQFRVSANPASFAAPGPTGPTLNLTWTAPTTLALQPSGGAVQVGSGCIAANGSVATALGSLGPVGSHTAVQEWIAIQNASGVTRYIPAF